MKKALLFAVVLLFTVTVSADWYIKSVSHTKKMEIMDQKQSPKDTYKELWIAGDKMAQVSDKAVIVVDMSKKEIYVIDNEEKSYFETDLPWDIGKILTPEQKQMMSWMKKTVKVTPTGETNIINNWKCKGYDLDKKMTMTTSKMKVWATRDIALDYSKFNGMYENIMKISQGMIDDDSMAEFKKIEGFQVLSEGVISVMGTNINTYYKVIEAKQATAPDGIYSVPAEYTKNDKIDLLKLYGIKDDGMNRSKSSNSRIKDQSFNKTHLDQNKIDNESFLNSNLSVSIPFDQSAPTDCFDVTLERSDLEKQYHEFGFNDIQMHRIHVKNRCDSHWIAMSAVYDIATYPKEIGNKRVFSREFFWNYSLDQYLWDNDPDILNDAGLPPHKELNQFLLTINKNYCLIFFDINDKDLDEFGKAYTYTVVNNAVTINEKRWGLDLFIADQDGYKSEGNFYTNRALSQRGQQLTYRDIVYKKEYPSKLPPTVMLSKIAEKLTGNAKARLLSLISRIKSN